MPKDSALFPNNPYLWPIKLIYFMAKQPKRFVWREKEMKGIFREADVIVDTETGVNYLLVVYGHGAGLTPLIDENGRPIVTRVIVDD